MLDFYSDERAGVINPSDIIEKVDNMPRVAVGCYSKALFDKIVEGAKCVPISKLSNTSGEKIIYELEYKGKRLVLFNVGVGAPMATADLEDLYEMGCDKFIIFGNCGVLDKKIDDCGIIIPTEAVREEGVSYHYLPASKTIIVNKKYQSEFVNILNNLGYKYTKCLTWTTDAFYRETRGKVNEMKELGVGVVEMETSALQAVADFRGFDLFTFFYAGDNLDLPEWDMRSLSGDVKLDEKSRIALLSLELGCRISEDLVIE